MSLCFKRFDRRSGAADRFSPDAFLTAMPTRNPPPGRLFLIQRGARTRLFAPMTPDGTVQPRHEIGGDVRRCLESNAHRVRSQCSVVVQGGAPACGPAPAPDICSSKTLSVPRGRYLYRRCAHPSLPRRSDVQTQLITLHPTDSAGRGCPRVSAVIEKSGVLLSAARQPSPPSGFSRHCRGPAPYP